MDPVAGGRGAAAEGAVGLGVVRRHRLGPFWMGRFGKAELFGLGGCEADVGGLDARVAGEFGGADAEDFAGVKRLGD